jgi:hypothetical protein
MVMHSAIEAARPDSLSAAPLDPITAAVSRANDWLRVARPVIQAFFALEDIEGNLGQAGHQFAPNRRWNQPKEFDEQTMQEAREILRKPTAEMQELIEAIRETFIADAMPSQPLRSVNPTDADWDAYDAEYERFEQAMTEVLTVQAAIKIVAEEL